MQPKCTTYTPNYNYHRKGFLTECLQSLSALSYPNLELLIIDDGSDDGSQEVIQEFAKHDRRVRYWLMPHRGIRWGQGYINYALSQATGEFFSVLDSDDKIEPNFWESTLPYFSSSLIGFVRVGLWRFGDCEQTWIKPKIWSHVGDILADNKVFVGSPFRTAMWKAVGDWDDNLSWSDWDFWARATIRHGWKWATCNEPLFWWRQHGAQLNAESKTTKQEELVDYMSSKYSNDLPNLPIVRKFGRRIEAKDTEEVKEEPLWRRFKHEA